jgi:hypothetical protein
MGQGAYGVRPTSKLFMKIMVSLMTTQFFIQVELGGSMPIRPYRKMNKSYFDEVEGQVATIWKEFYLFIYLVKMHKVI